MSNPRNNNPNEPANDSAPTSGEEQKTEHEQEGDGSEIAREAAQIAALHEEIADLKDRYLRSVAETENVRRRAERERTDATQFAFARFARDLLNVVDNFSRAFEALKPEVRSTLPPAALPVIDGIEATQRELLAILERHGIKRIQAKGQRFNPNLHQAIAEVPSNEPAGTVIEVVQDGYTIGERLLRPAMVAVAAQAGAKNGSGSSVDTSA
jgi:molecular chaperone GrpE